MKAATRYRTSWRARGCDQNAHHFRRLPDGGRAWLCRRCADIRPFNVRGESL